MHLAPSSFSDAQGLKLGEVVNHEGSRTVKPHRVAAGLGLLNAKPILSDISGISRGTALRPCVIPTNEVV